MVKSLKIMLIPNNVQETKMFQYAGAARFAYNWALGREKENYENGGKFTSDAELRKEFTKLRHTEEYSWLLNISNNVTKQAIKDACNAYMNFFRGLHWWISVGVEYTDSKEQLSDEGIGIDLGIKDLAVCSDTNKYKNINKSKKVKKLEKRKRRLQRKISRKYDKNKEGGSYCKTNNIIKSEKLLLKVNHRLTNIRKNYLHQTTSGIINRKPRFICIEDLNVRGMMKNKHLSKEVQNQGFFEFRKQLEYKCEAKGIQLITADRFYPSSKLCSCCGNIKKDLKLSDRIYKCECGNIIDRDFQAALNLKAYGEKFAS